MVLHYSCFPHFPIDLKAGATRSSPCQRQWCHPALATNAFPPVFGQISPQNLLLSITALMKLLYFYCSPHRPSTAPRSLSAISPLPFPVPLSHSTWSNSLVTPKSESLMPTWEVLEHLTTPSCLPDASLSGPQAEQVNVSKTLCVPLKTHFTFNLLPRWVAPYTAWDIGSPWVFLHPLHSTFNWLQNITKFFPIYFRNLPL